MTTTAELESALPDDLELTLDDVIVLLAREIERLKEALALIDVRVLDHFVVGEDVVSFAERGLI